MKNVIGLWVMIGLSCPQLASAIECDDLKEVFNSPPAQQAPTRERLLSGITRGIDAKKVLADRAGKPGNLGVLFMVSPADVAQAVTYLKMALVIEGVSNGDLFNKLSITEIDGQRNMIRVSDLSPKASLGFLSRFSGTIEVELPYTEKLALNLLPPEPSLGKISAYFVDIILRAKPNQTIQSMLIFASKEAGLQFLKSPPEHVKIKDSFSRYALVEATPDAILTLTNNALIASAGAP